MRMKHIRAIPWRVKVLVTRRWELFPGHISKETFRFMWGIVGIHSHNWWWVRKYGRLPCGCARNPLTRRWVWYMYGCPENHGSINTLLNKQGPVD